MLSYALLVVGWYSRRLEHEADLEACVDDEGRLDLVGACVFRSALAKLCGRSREGRLMQWLHPPVVSRLEFLLQVVNDPQVTPRFRRSLKLATRAMFVLYVLAALLIAY
jgi:Zn-dependent protease with chaperone function